MSEPNGDPAANAAGKLRDMAKWLVGGTIGAAALTFTGSAISKFGTIDPANVRFWIALGGLTLGFVGILLLMRVALDVMTYDAVSYQQLATDTDNSKDWVATRSEIDRMFTSWPYGLADFKDCYEVWSHRKPDQPTVAFSIKDGKAVSFEESDFTPVPTTPAPAPSPLDERIAALEAYVASLQPDELGRLYKKDAAPPPAAPAPPARFDKDGNPVVEAEVELVRSHMASAMAAAQFFKVKLRFERLQKWLPWHVLMMLVGFGIFAWAANPPPPPSAPPRPGIEIKITG